MQSRVNRRHFLATTAAGTALGATATTVVAAPGADPQPIPVPDADTKASADGAAGQVECCTPAEKLVFACSGAADVGKIADLAARKLTEDGVGKMFCLAGIGGRVEGIMEATKKAKAILAIDGCPLQCGRNTLEQAGFQSFEHLCLSDIGMRKGQTPATDKAVTKVAGQGKAMLPSNPVPTN